MIDSTDPPLITHREDTMQATEETHEDNRGAYRIAEMPGGVDLEVERLRQQALLAWPEEARQLKWFGLRDGMNILDVGSGPGFVSAQLLDMLPNSTVTGIELDPVMIEKSTSFLAPFLDNNRMTIVNGSLFNSGLPEASFDFAIARYVFQHLSDPVGAAREIRRLLKPGGKFVIHDIDDDSHLFEPKATPEVEAINARFLDEHTARGGDRHVGRKLLRILREAGFTAQTLQLIPIHSDEYGMDAIFPVTGNEALKASLDAGELNQEEYDILLDFDEKSRGPEAITLLILYLACGTNPTE
jgi:SAM-dependent methyltransferase